jgi:hypothetical protein
MMRTFRLVMIAITALVVGMLVIAGPSTTTAKKPPNGGREPTASATLEAKRPPNKRPPNGKILEPVAYTVAAARKGAIIFTDSTGDTHHGEWNHFYITSNGASHHINVQWDIYHNGGPCADEPSWIDVWCMKYHMSIDTNAIPGAPGNNCVQIGLDTGNSAQHHMDSQIMRNCRPNSTRTMDPFWWTVQGETRELGDNVFLSRLQIATYDRDGGCTSDGHEHQRNGCVSNFDCETIATNSDTLAGCNGWTDGSNADWGVPWATIRQKQPPGWSPADVFHNGSPWLSGT